MLYLEIHTNSTQHVLISEMSLTFCDYSNSICEKVLPDINKWYVVNHHSFVWLPIMEFYYGSLVCHDVGRGKHSLGMYVQGYS